MITQGDSRAKYDEDLDVTAKRLYDWCDIECLLVVLLVAVSNGNARNTANVAPVALCVHSITHTTSFRPAHRGGTNPKLTTLRIPRSSARGQARAARRAPALPGPAPCAFPCFTGGFAHFPPYLRQGLLALPHGGRWLGVERAEDSLAEACFASVIQIRLEGLHR